MTCGDLGLVLPEEGREAGGELMAPEQPQIKERKIPPHAESKMRFIDKDTGENYISS